MNSKYFNILKEEKSRYVTSHDYLINPLIIRVKNITFVIVFKEKKNEQSFRIFDISIGLKRKEV